MSAPRDCFLAMFDVLGFKRLRKERGTSGLHQLYMRMLIPSIQHAAASRTKTITVDGQRHVVPDETSWLVGFRVFSDTIVYVTNDDTFASFLAVLTASFKLLKSGFCGSKAPFRGAIGYGDLITEPAGVLLGSAVEDAYKGEQSQAWAGCSLTPSCQAHVEQAGFLALHDQLFAKAAEATEDTEDAATRKKLTLRRGLLVEYDIPTQHNPKSGPIQYATRRGLALDWTIQVYEGAAVKSFYPSDDAHAKVKAENTRVFEEWARSSRR